ncbi:phage late control D family protein [Pleurocapsa sp. PCC 7319]|uniref:phage late control D family protein n=1 Tax=Pleurocapsa sp. PCC 7319 TaxID=118161 RepID=UPI000348A5CA|nr:phage late control D family protein [Pleurocapsa sp. PCC 7319]
MDIVALEKKYQDLYAPTFEISIEGQNILQSGVEVTNVNVDNTLDGADTFSFTVFNAFDPINRELQSFVESVFSFDAEVEIKFGYGSQTKTIMLGIITAVKIDFPSGGSPQVEVSGFDLSYRMMKEKKPRSWNDKKDSEVIRNIAQEYQLTENIDDTGSQHEQIVKQEKENDFEFLNRLAERNYYEFFVFNKTLYFRKPQYRSAAIVTLEWQKSLVSFSPDFNIAERVFTIEVIGQNTEKKKNIVATAQIFNDEIAKIFINKAKRASQGRQTTEQLLKEQVKQPLKSEEHAKKLAQSILLKKHEDILKGSGESLGIPDIIAGTNIELIGLGSQFSNTYYIEQTNHSISNSGYKTTFNVKRVPNEDEIEVTTTITSLS